MWKKLRRYRELLLPAGIFILLLWGGAVVSRVDIAVLIAGIPDGVRLLKFMFPPEWAAFPELLGPALITVQIAFVGTVLGVILSFFVSLPASSNLSSRAVRDTVRGVIAAERALPDLIVMLFFVAIVGLGPFAGVMALAIGSLGMLGKLFADAIEEVDPKPLESMASVGATKSQIIRYAVLPQVLPSFIANSLYRFDVNIRMSVLLGAIGAGGIGFELVSAMSLFEYKKMAAAIITTLIMIVLCEKFSDALRKRVFGQETLQ
jgi:phosphonate transport system permease protein